MGLTDREIGSPVASIILHSLVLHTPESGAAAQWQELGTGNQDSAAEWSRSGCQQTTRILKFSLQRPPASAFL